MVHTVENSNAEIQKLKERNELEIFTIYFIVLCNQISCYTLYDQSYLTQTQ